MEVDYFPAWGYWWADNVRFVGNGAIVAFVCYLIITLKLLKSKDGAFRWFLIAYFGSSVFTAFLLSYWHPYYNYWIVPTSHVPQLIGLIALTGYILFEFWFTRRND